MLSEQEFHLEEGPREDMFEKVETLLLTLVENCTEIGSLSMHEAQEIQAIAENLIDPIHKVIKTAYLPHLRGEFPREAILKILRGVYHKEAFDVHETLPSVAVDRIERLWNGENVEVTGDMVKPRGEPVEGNDNLCGTCGGSGEVCGCYTGRLVSGPWDKDECFGCTVSTFQPCPDCAEKRKCLRCGIEITSPESCYSKEKRMDSHRFIDERGAGRRQGKKCRRSILGRRCMEDTEMPEPQPWHDGRRESQRRTLVGALRR